MASLDWSQCPAVESVPGRLNGAWVFRDSRLVGLVGTVGHVSDIGGTKDSLKAREIFEEGIQIPPMKLFRAGVPNEDLFTLLAENVRNPAQVLRAGVNLQAAVRQLQHAGRGAQQREVVRHRQDGDALRPRGGGRNR